MLANNALKHNAALFIFGLSNLCPVRQLVLSNSDGIFGNDNIAILQKRRWQKNVPGGYRIFFYFKRITHWVSCARSDWQLRTREGKS